MKKALALILAAMLALTLFAGCGGRQQFRYIVVGQHRRRFQRGIRRHGRRARRRSHH